MNRLNDLAKKYGTDKQIGAHGYTKHYYEQLKHLENEHINLIEFGVHTGASLMMWADFFKKGVIFGVDDGSSGDLKTNYPDHANIEFKKGSQNNEYCLNELKDGRTFDVIVDDGSHYSHDIVFTFKKMFYALKPGGYYIIEDLHCSYPPYTVGDLASRFNKDNFTAVQFINDMVDVLHTRGIISPIESITTYEGITFIKKK